MEFERAFRRTAEHIGGQGIYQEWVKVEHAPSASTLAERYAIVHFARVDRNGVAWP